MLKLFQSDAQRYAARMRRAAYWSQPIDGRGKRLRAWINLLVSDHGVIRLLYLNEHQVTPAFRRSAQPAPHDIRRLARAGVKTIVNLRGGREQGGWPLQVEACAAEGVVLKEWTMRSREPPDREMLLALPAFFASLQYPVLAHCKSGADRAGLFSALYLLVHEGRTVAEAKRQLSLRFGHVRMAKTGMLDAFLEAYEREGEARGVPFMDWVRDRYDPAAVRASFHEGFWASLLIDRLMRRE